MAQCQDLRVLSTAPTTPGAGVISLYVNSTSGLVSQDAAGKITWVGGPATGVIAAANVITGGAGTITTGVVFGQSVANQTGLGTPTAWLPFVSSNGAVLAVPAYALR